MPRDGVAESQGRLTLNTFLRILHTDFQCAFPVTVKLLFLYNLANIQSVILLILAILTGARQYLIVLLILISLVARDDEHLLSALLAIFIFSIENSLLRCLVHFSLIGLFP